MATNANPFIVNIIDLQNIALSITGNASGTAAITQLQSDVGNLQQMVHYDTKTITTDFLSEYTTGHGIDIVDTTINTTTVTASSTTIQGTMGFGYITNSLTGTTGSLPTTFASSTVTSGTTITITLTSTYSIANFPNYTGTLLWYTGTTYKSFSIPNGQYTGNSPYVDFNGSQINISNLTVATLPSITPDSSGYSLWLSMSIFN